VHLRGCQLLPAPGAPAAWAGQPVWQVLEAGFGPGLNFLATWQAWRQDPQRPARLFYSAIAAHPPEAAALLHSAAPWPELAPLAAQLAAQWRGLLPGLHRIELAGGALQLTLAVGDALPLLAELTGRFDSVFLGSADPHTPPAAHSPELLRAVARLCRVGARISAACTSADAPQRLAACGFELTRLHHLPPHLPPEHPALAARYAPRHAPRRRAQPGDVAPAAAPGHCAIVGAGLAGASLAHALAARGWQVTVLGQGDAPADGASALPAGLFAPHVSPDDRPLSRLSRAGCAATLARARALLREGQDFAASGVLERHAPGERRRPAAWLAAENATDSIAARALSACASAQIRAQASLPGDDAHPALWHAGAGWVRPAALVRALLAAPGIRFVGGAQVARIAAHGRAWQVLDAGGRVLAQADQVALAAGFATRALLQASLPEAAASGEPWPLHALRGQIAFGPRPTGADAALPPFPVNGHGNLVPAVPTADGAQWVLGATFERGATHPHTRADDHAANRQRLADLLPRAAATLGPQWDDGRAQAWAGVRCTAPDRLPLVGPLQTPDFKQNQPPARASQAQAAIESEANQPPAPWLLTALGSRGLTLAVLCGEVAAAWLAGEPLPVERSLAQALRASRWAERGARPAQRAHAAKHSTAP
jgi:tRNA 5-methylaminomethyl-2-thiouridine biosynthesis bifunctional protein